MAIPTYSNWMERTKGGVLTPRSAALRSLDRALEVYDNSKTEANLNTLKARLDDWIKTKGSGDRWKNSTRNRGSVVQELYDGILQLRVASLKAEYANSIRPAYVKSGYGDLPAELVVDETDDGVDGFGSPGLVQVSLGIANEPMSCLRNFAVAHESGHAVAYLACQNASVTIPQPIGDGAKRHEHLADLIAMQVLMQRLPNVAADVNRNLNSLSNWLGNGDFQHPSGERRARLIRRLHNGLGSFDQLIRDVVDPHTNIATLTN